MLCKICLEAASEPRVTRCGHPFCAECIGTWFEKDQAAKPTCPVCRAELNLATDLIAVYDHGPSEASASPKEKEVKEEGVLGGAESVSDFLQKVAEKYKKMERENGVLRQKVQHLTAEVGLLKCLRRPPTEARAGEGARRDVPGETPTDKRDMKENYDPRTDQGALSAKKTSKLRPARVYKSHRGPVHGVDISRNGRFVATASWDTTCKVHAIRGVDPETKSLETRSLEHEYGIYAVEFHPRSNGEVLCTASGNSCYLWNVATGTRLRCFEEGTAETEVNGLSFSSEGKRLGKGLSSRLCMTQL